MSGAEKSRSVVDYETEDALRKALMAVEAPKENDSPSEDSKPQAAASPSPETSSNGNNTETEQQPPNGKQGNQPLDWVLPSFDPENTEVQSMKEELHRLQVLKSYLILDSEREEAFDRITGIASRFFDVPIALVSLVDLGRQWFMSNRGLGSVRETPRKDAFCAHAILNKNNILIVNDARVDFRFKDNPLVTGPPHIRFYAGAPLICPEGYKLGTLCIIDSRHRPMGLTLDEQDTLHDLADMTMKAMVDRRYQLQTRENPAQLIAYTAHDLMTPLTGVQLSLSLLKEDEEVQRQLGPHHLELLKTAANCSDLMLRICQTVIDTLRQETPASLPTDLMGGSTGNIPVTKMAELVSSLSMIMEPIPKPVPLIITLDPSVPAMIMSDDLKLFRSALNLLSHALSRTELGYVHMKIFSKEETGCLMFECENTGRPVEVEEYQYVFQPSRTGDGILRLGLSSVASLINALDGEYGFRPRGIGSDGEALLDAKGRRKTGSVFWFSVPLFLPDSFGVDGGGSSKFPKRNRSFDASVQNGPIKMPVIPLMQRVGSTSSVSSANRHEPSFGSGDMLLADAVNRGCLNEVFAQQVQPAAAANPLLDQKMPALPRRPSESQNGVMHGNGESSAVPVVASLPTRKDKPSAPRMRRALVIDDILVVRKSIAVALKKMGFEVTQARDGMEGFACLKETMFDLTLCDFLMPVMDGMDCVKQYREWEAKNRSWFHQLIIGISAHASANDHGQGLKAGMDGFEPKPISIQKLTEIQGREVVRNRTKQLDEFEGSSESSTSSANAVNSEPVEPAPSAELKRGAREIEELEAKRRRTFPGANADDDHEPTVPVCLIATDTPTVKSSDVLTKLESNGWKVIVVHDGNDALRLLQMRNWDAVLIDDDLPVIAGTPCVTKFREWEQSNRVNKQKNVCLVCDGDIPSPDDKASVIQPPSGIDGVLRVPVQWKDLNYFIQRTKRDGALSIVVRDHKL